MRLEKRIPVRHIVMDRHPLNPSTLKLIDAIREDPTLILTLPPIKVQRDRDGRYLIRDGRHRVTAFKMLGIEMILARFSTEPMRVRSETFPVFDLKSWPVYETPLGLQEWNQPDFSRYMK